MRALVVALGFFLFIPAANAFCALGFGDCPGTLAVETECVSGSCRGPMWFYYVNKSNPDHEYLFATRATPQNLDVIKHELPSGEYRVGILTIYSDFSTFLSCWKPDSMAWRSGNQSQPDFVAIRSGTQTTMHFELDRDQCGGPDLPWDGQEHNDAPHVTRECMLIPVDDNECWSYIGGIVSQMSDQCYENASALRNVYDHVTRRPPSKPIIFISGSAISRDVTQFGDNSVPGLYDAEIDALLFRTLVANLKKRCWGWFDFSISGGTASRLANSVKQRVREYINELDELNKVADILDDVARSQSSR